MRIIAEPAHPDFKITVFKNGMKYSVQIESHSVQIILKLPEINAFDSDQKVINAVNNDLTAFMSSLINYNINQVSEKLSGYKDQSYFEEII